MKIVTLKRVIFISIFLSGLLAAVILLSVTVGSVRLPLRRSLQILFQAIFGLQGEGIGTETDHGPP